MIPTFSDNPNRLIVEKAAVLVEAYTPDRRILYRQMNE
jgi:hypothetical protein